VHPYLSDCCREYTRSSSTLGSSTARQPLPTEPRACWPCSEAGCGTSTRRHRARTSPSRLGQSCRVHIADDDQLVLASDLGGLLVKVMAPRVDDLGVDGGSPALVVGALRDLKSLLVLPIMLEGRDYGAIAACRQRLEAEVDTDRTVAGRQLVGHLTLEAQPEGRRCGPTWYDRRSRHRSAEKNRNIPSASN
jgi:hypothetical protein